MDTEDNVFDIGDVLEVSDDIATELVEAKKAEITDAPAPVVVKAEDMKAAMAEEVKKGIAEAMKDVKVEDDVAVIEGETKDMELSSDETLWKSDSEFLMAVKDASYGKMDERLTKGSGEGQEEADDTEGGYLVEHRIGTEIYQAAAQASVLYPKCRKMEIGPNQNGTKINRVNETLRSATSLFGGVRVYSMAEGASKTAFIQKYAQKDISLGKTAAISYVTDELLSDRTSLRSFIGKDVGSALAWVCDDDILHATTNASFNAIENDAATVRVTVAGANPTAAELTNMYVAMLPGCIAKAEWYMSLSQYAACMQLEDTSGRKLIQPSFELSAYGTLFGKLINVIEQADVDAEDTSIMFLDLSQYLVIEKGGIAEASSIHVKFLEDETCYRFVTRKGGAPLLASTITMPDGSICSPFVTRD